MVATAEKECINSLEHAAEDTENLSRILIEVNHAKVSLVTPEPLSTPGEQ